MQCDIVDFADVVKREMKTQCFFYYYIKSQHYNVKVLTSRLIDIKTNRDNSNITTNFRPHNRVNEP